MKRRSLVALLLVGLLAVLAAAAWIGYTKSPQYSLARLADAANRGDWEQVTVFVDTTAVSQQLASTLVSRSIEGEAIDLRALGFTGDLSAAPVAETTTELSKRIEKALRDAVVSRRSRRQSTRETLGLYALTARPDRMTIKGDRVLVAFTVPFESRFLALDVEMRRVGPVWRVVRILNAEELLFDNPAGGISMASPMGARAGLEVEIE